MRSHFGVGIVLMQNKQCTTGVSCVYLVLILSKRRKCQGHLRTLSRCLTCLRGHHAPTHGSGGATARYWRVLARQRMQCVV